MNYLIHPTYVDPATDRLIMTADPLQLTSSVTNAIQPGDASTSFNMPETTYVNTYVPPPVVPFSGDPSLLIIDTTKVPPLSVPSDGFDPIDVANQENINPQANRPKGSKRKATLLEEEEDNVPAPSPKRRNRVLKAKKENKKTEKADSSGADEKPFKCPQCSYSSKRQFNLNTHIKTHDINRVKEFVCSKCNKAFTRKNDRDRHAVNVHK